MDHRITQPLASPLEIHPKILYFGTPVALVSSANADGTTNLAPMSSAWALGWTILLGLGTDGQTLANLRERPECVLNLPSDGAWAAVEALAATTGRAPVPEAKRDRFRFVADKFAWAGLTPCPSGQVRPAGVAECPLRLEARVVREHAIGAGDPRLGPGAVAAVEVLVVRVVADASICAGDHLLPGRWRPLLYSFRHYFGLGEERGRSFRADTPEG